MITAADSQSKTSVQRMSRQAGMTLLEILVVLAIIGGVMAVLIPNITGNLEKSKIRSTQLAMGQLTQALTLYNNDCGTYPKSLDGLMQADADCGASWGPDPYLKKPIKDGWNRDFVYESDGSTFTMRSLGKDGRDGGEGANRDINNED